MFNHRLSLRHAVICRITQNPVFIFFSGPPPTLPVQQECALDGDLDLFIRRPGKRCADREPECGDCAEGSRTASDSRRINHRWRDGGERRSLNVKINELVSSKKIDR